MDRTQGTKVLSTYYVPSSNNVFIRNNSPFSEFFYKNQPLTVTRAYNFLGNIIDNKGNFKRSIQELSKKRLKVLFALNKYMSNFVNVPADLLCKLFDTLIRPILLYNSEVLFMENYLSIYKSVNRSRSHGTICDTLSLGDKFCFEKIHHRLGIRKTACNLAAKTELGRFPLDSFIKRGAQVAQ